MSYFTQYPRAHKALDILNRQKEWSPILEQVISRYEHTPEDLQKGLKEEMEEALIDLASMMDRMPDVPVGMIMARRLSLLECFYTRATKKGASGSNFWNPLDESFSEFKEKGRDVHLYTASERFPASDIIKKWSQENLQ